jgi:hypothetical protein
MCMWEGGRGAQLLASSFRFMHAVISISVIGLLNTLTFNGMGSTSTELVPIYAMADAYSEKDSSSKYHTPTLDWLIRLCLYSGWYADVTVVRGYWYYMYIGPCSIAL